MHNARRVVVSDFGDEFRQSSGASLANSTSRVLDRYLNVLPTVTIREGHRIKVYLTNDLELPAYAPSQEGCDDTTIRHQVWRASAAVVLLTLLATPLRAQGYDYVVYDPWSVAQSITEVFNLVRQYVEMIRQAQRLPVDLANRYRGQSVAWTLQDLASLYAQPLLNALNTGDPTGRAYQQIVHAIDVPTDILARMPAELQRRLRTAYATIELADGIAKRGIDQVGATRAIGGPCCRRSGSWNKTPPPRSTPSIRRRRS